MMKAQLTMTAAFVIGIMPMVGSSHEAWAGSSQGKGGDKPIVRACTARDIVGHWSLVKWNAPVHFNNPHAPYVMPHQVFQFGEDGAMKSAHSEKAFESSPAKVLQNVPSAVTYQVNAQGVMTVRAEEHPDASESWECSAVTENVDDQKRQVHLKRGDVVMTLWGKDGQPLDVRQLRK
ncbi:MAG: hypothetical protein HZB35_00450 [Nitrospirae bacterium]|nr:hypothetical protein [Nitrospirota bacterium]